MEYIVHKRYKGNCVGGTVNLPAMTICECNNDIISHNGRDICYTKSEVAHQHFAINEDGMGVERGKLTQAIQKRLEPQAQGFGDLESHQDRWDKVWDDKICQAYKREDYEDYWLWNHDFFNAEIDALRHIAKLIGAKEDA